MRFIKITDEDVLHVRSYAIFMGVFVFVSVCIFVRPHGFVRLLSIAVYAFALSIIAGIALRLAFKIYMLLIGRHL